ncbi:unnamed protein product [Timema podura]|uniref:Uncharacterized protein n=1 Tax=Timema podura TaxID=61482 RepID=A0ABN7PCU4_TIMPD|nr:unnamed protein product [Timema podura]
MRVNGDRAHIADVVYSPRSPVLEKIMNNTATKLGLQGTVLGYSTDHDDPYQWAHCHRSIPMPSERFFLSLLKTNYVFMKLNLAAVFFDESLEGAKKLSKNITVAKSSTNPTSSL